MVCPYGPLCHPCGSKEGGKNEKTTLPCGPLCHPCQKQGRRKKRKKHVVCPYGPLCQPWEKQGRRKKRKTTLCKTWFFRGLPKLASMSPLWEARKEEKTKKPHSVKRGYFVVCPYRPVCPPLQLCKTCFFSWFAHMHPCGSKGGGKNEKTTLCKTWFFGGWHICNFFADNASVLILCDFPSYIKDHSFRCQVFGLEDISYFLQAITHDSDSFVLITTQQYSSLKKLLTSEPISSQQIQFFTRTATASPYELKMIEIFHSIPEVFFFKTQSLQYLSSFSTSLRTKNMEQTKYFVFFLLLQDFESQAEKLLIKDPSPQVYGCCFSSEPSLVTQASTLLAEQATKHSFTNTLQVVLPKDTEIISYQVEFQENSNATQIFEFLNSLSFLSSFYFSGLMAAHHNSPEYVSCNFFNTKAIDCEALMAIFDMMQIHYVQLRQFLIFRANRHDMEQVISFAQESSMSIPPSFISTTIKLSFEKINDHIYASIIPATQDSFLELQITREDVCCSSDIFWSPEFLDFLRTRFLCLNKPELKIVRSSSNSISEVLAFIGSCSLFDTISSDDLPFAFTYADHSFTLSRLEPLFIRKPKPLSNTPLNPKVFTYSELLANMIHSLPEYQFCFHTPPMEVRVLQTSSILSLWVNSLNVTQLSLICLCAIVPTFISSYLHWKINGLRILISYSPPNHYNCMLHPWMNSPFTPHISCSLKHCLMLLILYLTLMNLLLPCLNKAGSPCPVSLYHTYFS